MYYGMMMMINCLCGMVFPLSGFSFMDIQDSQDCLFNSSLPFPPALQTWALAGRLLRGAHLCAWLVEGLGPGTFGFGAKVANH